MIYPADKKDSDDKSKEIKLTSIERAEFIWRKNMPAMNKLSDKIKTRNRH